VGSIPAACTFIDFLLDDEFSEGFNGEAVEKA
jgi:hypothetical protein